MEIVVPKGAKDHDFCEAVWPDDSRTAIAELTLQAHQASHRPSPGASSAWQKLHTVTKNVISVRKRVDRSLLMSIYEQGAQVCQVNVHAKFGETSEAALRREILEETNLEIDDVQFVLVQDCIHSTEFYRDAHFVLLNYTCRCVGEPQVRLNEEAQEFRWLTVDEAMKLELNQPTKILLDAVRSPEAQGVMTD